jgi:hypothetical protein
MTAAENQSAVTLFRHENQTRDTPECVVLQALQGGVLTAAMLEHLTNEQSEWLLAHLAACNPKAPDPFGSSSADDSSPAVAQITSDQHEALKDFLVGATAAGEQLSNQHYGCLAQHCEVAAAAHRIWDKRMCADMVPHDGVRRICPCATDRQMPWAPHRTQTWM